MQKIFNASLSQKISLNNSIILSNDNNKTNSMLENSFNILSANRIPSSKKNYYFNDSHYQLQQKIPSRSTIFDKKCIQISLPMLQKSNIHEKLINDQRSNQSTMLNSKNLSKKTIFISDISNKKKTLKKDYKSKSISKIKDIYLKNFELKKFIISDNELISKKEDLSSFIEKHQMLRKMNYINHHIKTKLKEFKKIDIYSILDKHYKNANLIYDNYKNKMVNYLFFIKEKIFNERKTLDKIISEEKHQMILINELKHKINKAKKNIIKNKEIKEFLKKVKFYSLTIEKNNNDTNNNNNNNSNNNASNISVKNRNSVPVFITPVNTKKDDKIVKNKNLTKSNSLRSRKKKRKSSVNYEIFKSPEDFHNCYNLKNERILDIMSLTKIKNDELFIVKNELKTVQEVGKEFKQIDNNMEIKYIELLDQLKNENKLLNEKLKNCCKIKKDNTVINNIITVKIQNIFNEINKNIHSIEIDQISHDEKRRSPNIIALEIIEVILCKLILKDKQYRNNPKLKFLYKQCRNMNDREKIKRIRKEQLIKLKKKREEEIKKIFDNYTKTRFLYLNKKGMQVYNSKKYLRRNLSDLCVSPSENVNSSSILGNKKLNSVICKKGEYDYSYLYY